jgi:hypothetical protein
MEGGGYPCFCMLGLDKEMLGEEERLMEEEGIEGTG